MDLVKSFVIGSSAPIFVPFSAGVEIMDDKNFSSKGYPIVASLYFGFMNTLATIIGKVWNISIFQRLFIINMFSIIFIISWITINKSYDFDSRSRWHGQYVLVAVAHTVAYLGLMQLMEKTI